MNFTDYPIIAVAISIIICWALFAILCSLCHEAIVQSIAERGRFMRKYLLNQLQDFSNDINWGSILYMHGSIDLLSRDAGEPPRDINPRLFAETLVEVVGSSGLVQGKKDATKGIIYKKDTLLNFKAATNVLAQSDVIGFLTQALKSAEQSATEDSNGEMAKINIENEIYKKLIDNIEIWYNNLMGRVSIWYKKRTRVRLFWLGCILGLLLNIDSIQLFNHFNANPESRKAIMQYYEKNASELETKAALQTDTSAVPDMRKKAKEYLDSLKVTAESANLPVGLDKNIFNAALPSTSVFRYILFKLFGIIITGFAASFGAPFWFDVLRKAYSTKKP